MNRKKLETLIERSIHNFVTEIKEHIVDFTVLTLRKENPKVDMDNLKKVLDVVQMGVEDGFMTRIDRFMKGLNKTLEELEVDQEHPFPSGTERKTVPQKKPGRR